jgi:8-oxo-dGTP diphosphatase
MPREYPRHPLPGVLAVVARGNRVLLVRRERDPDRGKWGFPGGLVELGETVAEAALRELFEETGIAAEAEAAVEVIDAIIRDDDRRVRYHYVLSVVACRWRSGEGVAGDDAGAVGWFSLDDLAAMPCSRNVERIARAALQA